MTQLTLREASRSDLDAIYELECASFASPWSKASFARDLASGRVLMLCAYDNGQLAGYGQANYYHDEVHITSLATMPAYRRQGVAALVLGEIMERVKGAYLITLEVRVSNAPAIALYEKFGFQTVYTRKNYYTDNGEDAYVMDYKGVWQ